MQEYCNNMQMLLQEIAKKYGASIRPSPAMRQIDQRASAISEWVTSERRQHVPVRVLGRLGGGNNQDAASGVNNWLRRNNADNRNPVDGEFLNINPFRDWSGSINQGWIQGAFDRGHMFRLLTEVPEHLVNSHNRAAEKPTPGNLDDYKSAIRDSIGWGHRTSVFAKELLECARNGYVIHVAQNSDRSVMPYRKSQLLNDIRKR
jgi:hypothetical protein